MAAKNRQIIFSDEGQISVPDRDMMIVEKRDWRRILRHVQGIKDVRNRWENAAWCAAAAAGTCGISAFVPKFNAVYLCLTLIGVAFSAVLFIASSKFGESISTSRNEIITDMEEIQTTSAVDSMAPRLQILKAVYGTDTASKVVTEELRAMIVDDTLVTIASNDIAGDPHQGVGKILKIEYMYDGERINRTYSESAEVKLP